MEKNYGRDKKVRKKALQLYNNHFCLIRKSDQTKFNISIGELKANVKNLTNTKLIKTLIVTSNVNINLKKEKTK